MSLNMTWMHVVYSSFFLFLSLGTLSYRKKRCRRQPSLLVFVWFNFILFLFCFLHRCKRLTKQRRYFEADFLPYHRTFC